MKIFLCAISSFFLVAALAPAGIAQPAASLQAGQRQAASVSVQPIYQTFKVDSLDISEGSVPVLLYVPVGRNMGVAVQAALANARGNEFSTLAGITDAQVHLSHYRALGRGSIVSSLRVNVPTGTEELSRDEFATLRQLSLNQYDFQIPGLGAGFGVSPGITVALPLTEGVVFGFGIAYQHRGRYKPIKNMVDSYKPGNEWLLTGGIDVRLSAALEVTLDATYTLYGKDFIGDEAFFEAGDKVVANVRFRYTRGYNSAWLTGLYRSRAKNALTAPDGRGVAEEFRTLPDQGSIFGGYRARLGRNFYLSALGEARIFGETAILPDVKSVYGAGASLEIPVSSAILLPLRAIYHTGDLTGFEVGLGIRARISS